MFKRLAATLGVFLISGAVGAGELAWVKDYDSAVEQAQKDNKRLLIDFYSPT